MLEARNNRRGSASQLELLRTVSAFPYIAAPCPLGPAGGRVHTLVSLVALGARGCCALEVAVALSIVFVNDCPAVFSIFVDAVRHNHQLMRGSVFALL